MAVAAFWTYETGGAWAFDARATNRLRISGVIGNRVECKNLTEEQWA